MSQSKAFPQLLRRRYVLLAALVTFILWLIVTLCLYPLKSADGTYSHYPYGLLTRLENQGADLLYQLRDALHPERAEQARREPITIIAIDERSIKLSKTRPLFWRDRYARLIEIANEGGASVIGLDIFLSEVNSNCAEAETGDQALASAIEKSDKVVLAKTLAVGGHEAQQPHDIFYEPSRGAGFVEIPPDPDGFVRSVSLFVPQADGKNSLSFATLLAQEYLYTLDGQEHQLSDSRADGSPAPYGTVILNGREIELRRDLNLQLDFRTRSPAFRQISAADLLEEGAPPIPKELFEKRIVLIGATYLGSQDTYLTPLFEPSVLAQLVNRRAESTGPVPTPGVELHATAIATMLWGQGLRRPAFIWQALMLALVFALNALAVFRLNILWGTLCVVLLACAVLFVSSYTFNQRGLLLPLSGAWLGVALLTPLGLSMRYGRERILRGETEREGHRVFEIFSRCVSREVAEEMRRRGDHLSLLSQSRDVTIIFTDIRNFTSLSDEADPDFVVEWLNDYFGRMHNVVVSHGGHINKFIGDGLLIVFGAPVEREARDAARAAVDCGLAMLYETERINVDWKDSGRPEIKIGVGIHSGKATCGVVGAEERLEYTVIGDAVNLASRLEAKTKDLKVPLLISEATLELIGDRYVTEKLGEVEVKGKRQLVRVFSVSGIRQEP
ncbi:MAG: adenylate/guanylate cyclase domain-containing protein [Pyrinomonadaceae bacterium]|nr:adenylate/guanylate cyclase domain-containing protein [Pyrinomonadaceae bacterium]